jgi:hypothetical protein
MIVKNESHIIKETLLNITQYFNFDYYIICDTGSVDNTKEIIQLFFNEKKINGEIFDTPWENFGKNRTIALEKAYKKTDYLFIFDADDKIHGELKIPEFLDADNYEFKFGNNFCYKRTLLINNHKKWEFKGVLHEYLNTLEKINKTELIEGNYYIESGRQGFRNKSVNKYYNDALLLENAYNIEKDISLKNRYAFYIAQSYKDSNYINKAIKWYETVLLLNNWLQEKYYSCIMLGYLYKNIDKNKSIYYYLNSIIYDKNRIEGIVYACIEYYNEKNYLLVHLLANKFNKINRINLQNKNTKLFLNLDLYNDQLDYYNSISSYYINEKENGYHSLKKILKNQLINHNQLYYSLKNISFYKEQIINDLYFLDFYKDFINCINYLNNYKNDKIIQENLLFLNEIRNNNF